MSDTDTSDAGSFASAVEDMDSERALDSAQESDSADGETERVDIVARLPPEMALRILGELPVEDVVRCLEVSRTWNKLARDGSIWRELCRKRWADKFNHPHELHVRVDYTNLARDLSVREIKRLLARRGITSAAKCIEKSELVELLKRTTPAESPSVRLAPKWLAAYAVAELDSKRNRITKDELCGIKWQFRFINGWPRSMSSTASFLRDNTYESPLFERALHWRFYGDHVQVEQYPPLRCIRTEEWGWILTNSYVVYYLPDSALPNPKARTDMKIPVVSEAFDADSP
ncbi:hypothetical protein HK105_206727 [Polyrhizophydium stewartii]|uniref:F-box domain-containing protein n=1 Tax=Polyrhizophydium stewartii TaxID=2732419 RepID=A0ABR4N2M2_9FUNG|nr:hypothetical protein HK105_007310 [Polyrhizophydium stewartii]